MIKKFLPPHPLRTPILFLVFNRPDLTERVLSEIRKAKPTRLYLASDGPRDGKEGENDLVHKVREIVKSVDWPCEVKTLLREKNLGCKHGVSEAITWFFEQEEQGIILEDDCLPSQSFFWFCEELLDKYKNSDVSMISGYTIVEENSEIPYRFSNLMNIWGWASWKRSWEHYSVNLDAKRINQNSHIFSRFLGHSDNEKKKFIQFVEKKVETWDMQWIFSCMKNYNYAILPTKSLIKNIGFDKRATHTQNTHKLYESVSRKEITFPIKHIENKNLYEMNVLDQKYLSVLNKKDYLKYLFNIMTNTIKLIKFKK